MHAYPDTYLDVAQHKLGSMLDFAANGCGRSLTSFYKSFLSSGLANLIEQGDPSALAGKSGVELALEVIRIDKQLPVAPETIIRKAQTYAPISGASPEFWTGWSLAYYQWESGRPFERIDKGVPVQEVLEMYHPYHEMDISAFCKEMERRLIEANPTTRLQELRRAAGMSQAQLAQATEIPVRTLQQYEQRQKCIDKAQVRYVLKLARALHCSPEDLLEYQSESSYNYAVVKMP